MDSWRTKNIYKLESVLSKENLFYREFVFLYCDWSECTKYMKHFTCDPNMTVDSPFSASKWSRCKTEIHKPLLWHINKYLELSELHTLVIHHIIIVFNYDCLTYSGSNVDYSTYLCHRLYLKYSIFLNDVENVFCYTFLELCTNNFFLILANTVVSSHKHCFMPCSPNSVTY